MRGYSFFVGMVVGLFFMAAGGTGVARADALTGEGRLSAQAQRVLERKVFTLVNDYRQAQKLAPLTWRDAVAEVARAHSREMSNGAPFSHQGFGDRVHEMKASLIGLQGAGENILKTDDPTDVARHAVTIWLGSPHHLENIRGDYNFSGIGVWEGEDGVIYFTQLFVKLAPPGPEVRAAPGATTGVPMVTLL